LRPVDKLPLGRSAPGVRVNRLADLNHLGVSAIDKLPLGRSAPGVRVNRLADLNHLGVSAICKWERSIPVVANEVPWSTGYGGTISVRRGTDNRRMHKFLSNPNF
jgi:hypothetical protein